MPNDAHMDDANAEAAVTSSLAYCCVNKRMAVVVRQRGLHPEAESLRLYDAYESARTECDEMLLVIDVYAVEKSGGDLQRLVPPEAVTNIGPYRKPAPVTAGGGIITRLSADALEVLLIFRRGVWDLPKGKRDAGESIRACALREVREELGIDEVSIVRRLGETVHGYPDGSAYAVKTTHWFGMKTTARQFEPQAAENIEAAQWFEWEEAGRRVGYDSLRRHMRRIEHLVIPR